MYNVNFLRKEDDMQHGQEDGGGHVEMSSPASSDPSTSNSHIDLKDFPSHLDYPSLDHDTRAFQTDNSEITRQTSGFSKSSLYNSSSRPRVTNLMFPKMRRRPFQCKYCTFSCPSATNLSIHMRIHTGEKPFKCGTCAYASARKQNLFRHMSTVHKADHVTMCGPPAATCAYPIGIQSSVEERMPVVENVYGNVQDVVLIDGDPVKIISRDQGSFTAPDAASLSPHLTQVFPCESASSNNQQDDVVEVIPASKPAPATEYSTRHYADGSRFIFAGGVAATATSSAAKVCVPQSSILDQQFDTSKEIQQTQTSILNNGGVHPLHVQSLISPDEGSVNKLESPVQPSVYKEPITGALKRKQGRVISHSTLKDILDSPLMLQNKVASNSAPVSSKGLSSIDHLEKTCTEIKIIQSEKDLEEVLEGRHRTNIRVASSGVSKQVDFTPSPRSINGGASVESAALSYVRESPNNVYFTETSPVGGTKEVATASTDSIPLSQTGVLHLKLMNQSSARKPSEVTSCQPASEEVVMFAQATKRASTTSNSSRRNVMQQVIEDPCQLSARNNCSAGTEGEGHVESNSYIFHDQNTLVRGHHPMKTFDIDSDQSYKQRTPRKDSSKSPGRISLTVQFDLNKVMCCAARKWLKSHLDDCDVCEINLPCDHEERHYTSESDGCGVERFFAQGNKSNPSREKCKEYHDQSCLEGGRQFSCGSHEGKIPTQIYERESRNTQRQHQASSMAVDDELSPSDPRDTISRGDHRDIFSTGTLSISTANQSQSRDEISGSSKQTNIGGNSRKSCPHLSSNNEHIARAETQVISSSNIPISSPCIRVNAPGTVDHNIRFIGKPRESAEYIAFLNAEQARGKSATKRHCQKPKYICDICGKVCRSKARLLSHRRIIHIETSQLFRCAVCRYCTLNYKVLKRHIADKHASVTKKNTFTKCKICKKAVRIAMTASHMQTVHGLGIQVADENSDSRDDGRRAVEQTDIHAQVAEKMNMGNMAAVSMETESDSNTEADVSQNTANNAAMADGSSTQALAIKQEPTQED